MGQAERVALPDDVRALAGVRTDYDDCFVAETKRADKRTAEEWARAMLEDAPPHVRQSLRRGWRMLGLRQGPLDTPDCILGWRFRLREPDVVMLAGESLLGFRAELLFKRERGKLLFATFVEERTPWSRLLWWRLAPVHQRVVSRLLSRAATP